MWGFYLSSCFIIITEFDKWYSESFLSVADDGSSTSMNAGHGIRPGVLPPFNPNTVVSLFSSEVSSTIYRLHRWCNCVLVSSAVDRGFEPWSSHSKDYEICICCFSARHTALRSRSKDWLIRNQNNVSKWGDMSTHGLLVQWARTKKSNSACWSRI